MSDSTTTPVPQPESGEQPSAVTSELEAVRSELEGVRAELEAAQARAAEYLAGWQRALADFDNYRKRVERDRAAEAMYARGEVLKLFLPVLDDLELALANRPDENGRQAWVEGIELIQRKLRAALENEGLEQIPAEGELFNPELHEALTHEESPDHESGRIIAVVRQGYRLGERVLRPAQVRVAR